MDGRPGRAGDLVFLVEDHEDTREMTRELLELEGHAVSAHGDALSALSALRRMPIVPCIILLDVRLPGLSGLDLLRELREDPALARVPVILTTASAREDLGNLRLPFLRKPFDPDVLLLAIRRHCRHCDGDGKSGIA